MPQEIRWQMQAMGEEISISNEYTTRFGNTSVKGNSRAKAGYLAFGVCKGTFQGRDQQISSCTLLG